MIAAPRPRTTAGSPRSANVSWSPKGEPLIEVYRRNERGNWELFVEARRGELAELTSCGEPIALDVAAIYRDPLAG